MSHVLAITVTALAVASTAQASEYPAFRNVTLAHLAFEGSIESYREIDYHVFDVPSTEGSYDAWVMIDAALTGALPGREDADLTPAVSLFRHDPEGVLGLIEGNPIRRSLLPSELYPRPDTVDDPAVFEPEPQRKLRVSPGKYVLGVGHWTHNRGGLPLYRYEERQGLNKIDAQLEQNDYRGGTYRATVAVLDSVWEDEAAPAPDPTPDPAVVPAPAGLPLLGGLAFIGALRTRSSPGQRAA